MAMFTQAELKTALRRATAKTAWRWRKRLKIKQMKIDSLEESVRCLRIDMERQQAAARDTERKLERYTREAMLETRFTTAKDIYEDPFGHPTLTPRG